MTNTSSREQSRAVATSPGSHAQHLADGTLLTSGKDGQAYLVQGGQRQLITDVAALFAAGVDPHSAPHAVLAPEELDKVPTAPAPIAALVSTRVIDTGDVFLGAGHYMRTWGSISPTGQVAMQTRTRSVTWFGGFHGAARLIAADSNGAPTFQSQDHRYGVDGTWIGRSDRTDAWWENMGADAAGRTTQVAIFHAWAPDEFQVVLDKWVRAGDSLGKLAQSVGTVAKVFMTVL